ncbi:MAG: aspartate--tRNA ligase [Candidatus Aenigmatarchaeota archaeon]
MKMERVKCTDLNENNSGEDVLLKGWIESKRELGKIIFGVLRDRSGKVQLVAKNDKDFFKKLGKINRESVIEIHGTVSERPEKDKNEDMETGGIEIQINDMKVLSEAEELPIPIQEEEKVFEDMKFKYRYLDLRKEKSRENLEKRHRIFSSIRNYLDNNNFVEVETPMLTKSTPEGARDFLVPSRLEKGKFYALPQSPQLFKQILMVSGLEKYYQIVKCFRDEDLRADRQPEFTQLDIEMSFVDEDDVFNFVKGLVKNLMKEIENERITIEKIQYKEVMKKYGNDSPDLRFGLEMTDLSEIVELETGDHEEIAKGISLNEKVGEIMNDVNELIKKYSSKKCKILHYSEENNNQRLENEAILNKMDYENGNLLFVGIGEEKEVNNNLGKLREELGERCDLYRKEYAFVWVYDFPLFEFKEEEGRWGSMHHPFTMVKDKDVKKLEKNDFEDVYSKAYDLVLNGHEVGGGSIRIHNIDLQKKILEKIGVDKEEAERRFGFFLEALKYGTPPHGGIAFGMDRFVQILCGEKNINEVIAFPKNKQGRCLLTGAPSKVDKEQLDDVGIELKKDQNK